MKILANSIREGNILKYQNNLWIVSKNPEHTKPGKGGAYIQLEMKNLKTGTKIYERFSSSEYLEKAMLEQKNYQYLYQENNHLVLMDLQNFEQILVKKSIIADNKLPFLLENTVVTIETYQNEIIRLVLPNTVVVEILETSPNIKGATVTSSYKPAILTNGAKIMVPPYLSPREKIVVKLEDLSFVERAK
ncbi:translation elongation factor P [Orientia chuto str. Dubai]|uniref:Elongation factor P n=1 Tax=Orientia chuto str. Dubai TaxID=1359168 RepID=A0A0F3MKF9_9RICK|nr:elongation factor P [Candidatus Orientia mediorientalis]KJV55064.1 translation elongation factor P [Orientia chuto str. Dubai]